MREYNITVEAAQQILEIMATAMLVNAKGEYHVFVEFAGHVNCLDVRAFPSSHNYQAADLGQRATAMVIRHNVRLQEPDAHDQLRQVAAELSQLPAASRQCGGDHA